MTDSRNIFVGIDGGATTSKIAAVREDASVVSMDLLQRPTSAEGGPDGVIGAWIAAIGEFLEANGLSWGQIQGVGVAVPGPRRSEGVLDYSPNLPECFTGWDVDADLSAALERAIGRAVPLSLGNDGNMGGVAEAQRVKGENNGSVIMLAPGSGLGGAYVNGNGLPLDGDSLAGMEVGHKPAPLHLLDAKPYPCGCGRSWGCYDLHQPGRSALPPGGGPAAPPPGHELEGSDLPPKKRAMELRGLAQDGDPLALELFDFQAKAMGILIADLAMAIDPETFVIGGGLMDPESTTEEFRDRYLGQVRDTAEEYIWPTQREHLKIVPASLGELSQAIGAALVALIEHRRDAQ